MTNKDKNAYKESIRQVIETDTLTTEEKVEAINEVVSWFITKLNWTEKQLKNITSNLFN